MKPRRGSKPRHKFRFTLTVNHIIFPKAISHKLSSSKFYVLLSRADKNCQTQVGSISKGGKIEYNQEISIQATLLKNRSTNAYISKHCRIVLRQLKHSNNPHAKVRESSVGSIKFDLVDYINRIPSEQKLTFTKCALQDVFISCTIKSKELALEPVYDDNMSVTSANTVRVDSFWLDKSISDEQKSSSPLITNGYMESEGDEPQHEGDIASDDTIPIERKDRLQLRLTDQHLIQYGSNTGIKQKEMASFRIKHAMDVMANENSYMDDLYGMYEKQKKELYTAQQRIDRLERLVVEKDMELKHFTDEERKWSVSMVEWEREKSNFEACNIELNFKYQQEKELRRKCKKELSEITLSTKRIIVEKQRIEIKYNNLITSLSADRNPLLKELCKLQTDYDDLEESLIQQQNSWRDTGNILEGELEKQKRKFQKAVNELKKYKMKNHALSQENGKLCKKIEKLKYQHENDRIDMQIQEQKLIDMKNMKNINIEKSESVRIIGNVGGGESSAGAGDADDEDSGIVNENDMSDKEDKKGKKERKERRNSSVIANIKKFNTATTMNKERKRRKSGKFKRKSMPRNNYLELEKEKKNKNKHKKRTKPKAKAKIKNNINSPMLKKMNATKLTTVQSMINKLEKEENVMIEHELLSPVIQNAEQIENQEEEEEEGRNIDIGSDIQEEEKQQQPTHRHVRSKNSMIDPDNLGINIDELTAINNISNNDDDNLSDLSQNLQPEIVHDID